MANEYIYVGQESLLMKLNTNIDLSGASSVKIKYRKPDATEGSWTGTVSGTYVTKAFIADEGELDTAGNWVFWSWATMADGRTIPGKPVEYYIKLEGRV